MRSRARQREIRDVVLHLSKHRGHTTKFIQDFVSRHYFVQDYYSILKKADEEPVKEDEASVVYKTVMNNEYFDL